MSKKSVNIVLREISAEEIIVELEEKEYPATKVATISHNGLIPLMLVEMSQKYKSVYNPNQLPRFKNWK